MAEIEITSLYRYPVKGLSPERLDKAELEPGGIIAWDRAFAIENGSRDVDPAKPEYFPKIKFLMLMRNERLAALDTRFDEESEELIIERDGRRLAKGKLTDPAGRAIIEQFLSSFMSGDLRGAPRIVHAPGFSFSDVPMKCLSLINLASVRDLERVVGHPVDPLRFRANVYFDGIGPWAEREWIGRELALGSDVKAKAVMHTTRCAATNVDPETGERDMAIPETLMRAFGHMDLGFYAEVSRGGTITPGDGIALA